MKNVDVKKLVMDLKLAQIVEDGDTEYEIKHKLYNHIRKYSALLKVTLNEDLNCIRDIFISNLKSNKFKVSMSVDSKDEAIGLLKGINLIEILELSAEVYKDFNFIMAVDVVEDEHVITEGTIDEVNEDITSNNGIIIESKIEKINDTREKYRVKYLKKYGKAYVKAINEEGELDYKVILKDVNIKLNIIEIYKILFNTTFNIALKDLCRFCDIDIKNENFSFIDEQEVKYKHNLEVLDKLSCSNKIIYNYIKEYSVNILQYINEFAINNFLDKEFSIDNESVMFFSNKFIAKEIDRKEPYGQCTIGVKLNVSSCLGLLIKLRTNELPKKGKICWVFGKHVNYYMIPKYTEELLLEVEKRVNKLLENGITASKISGSTCNKVFGEKMYLDIYGNTKLSVDKAVQTKMFKKATKDIEG